MRKSIPKDGFSYSTEDALLFLFCNIDFAKRLIIYANNENPNIILLVILCPNGGVRKVPVVVLVQLVLHFSFHRKSQCRQTVCL